MRAGPLHIGICAEYDSLPSMGHACGHNGGEPEIDGTSAVEILSFSRARKGFS